MLSLNALLRQSPSLRRVLLLPYILLVLGLALAIGLLSYLSGSRAVESVANSLLQRTVQSIGQVVTHHLSGSAAVLEAAFPLDMPAPQDIREQQRELTERLWVATSLHPDPNFYVYYGNRLGQTFGLMRRSPNEAELRIRLSPNEPRSIYLIRSLRGEPQSLRVEESIFDPRQRPWYQAGLQTRAHVWTRVYIDYVTEELVMTRARSVHSAGGQFEGVAATDIYLRMLNSFVSNLDVSSNGLAFIMEPDGSLIASSRGANVTADRHIGLQRLNAGASSDPLIHDIYEELRRHLNPAARSTPSDNSFQFETAEGENLHVAFEWIRDGAGLAWITVVAVPRSDLLGDVRGNAIRTALISAVAVALTLLLGIYVGNWVVRDITRLSHAASQIGEGRLDMRLRIERNDEIGQLARAVENMHQELSTDRLTGLHSRSALLRHLEYSITRHQNSAAAAPGFALLFIDLNGFKAINDTYGHEAGDQALAEVAERLRDAVRLGDLVARLGGDEFVLVLWRVDDEEVVQRAAEKIEQALRQPLRRLERFAGSSPVTVGAAIGMAFYPRHGRDASSLLAHADRSMYRDKRAGREYDAERTTVD
jgi:diguanylate cyclase (GGDEF)-like protein